MGIPHLITLLEPYAEAQSLAGQSVVIDGPAFAYHIYSLCVAARSQARGPFQALPTYTELARASIEWLDTLREHGVSIKKIYFDGFLPSSKLDVRLSRLIATTRRMSDYFYANQLVHLPSQTSFVENTSLFEQTAVPTRLTALPPQPFLVPAVLEALQESAKYSRLTQVVPGEADLYCSKYLSEHGGVILSGDSDLLVHDLGPDGRVSFLKDINMSANTRKSLRSRVYWPTAIARRLALPSSHGLRSIAFELIMDSHCSFPELLKRAKSLRAITSHPLKFEEFQTQYLSLEFEAREGYLPGNPLSLLQQVDPRVSEYLLQFRSIADLARIDSTESSPPETHVFLPFLIDSPTRTSAWEMSSSVRKLAYELINLIVPEPQRKRIVFEHKKQTDKSQGREISLQPPSFADADCATLCAKLSLLRTRLPDLSPQYFWLALAVYQDIEWAHLQLKTSTVTLARREIAASAGSTAKTSSWDTIQLFAQIQASYFSFRMLKQIMAFTIVFGEESDLTMPESILELHKFLGSLPKLAQLHDISQLSIILQFIESSGVFDVVCDILGIERQTAPEPEAEKATKKKRKRAKLAVEQRRPASNNPFALLGED